MSKRLWIAAAAAVLILGTGAALRADTPGVETAAPLAADQPRLTAPADSPAGTDDDSGPAAPVPPPTESPSGAQGGDEISFSIMSQPAPAGGEIDSLRRESAKPSDN